MTATKERDRAAGAEPAIGAARPPRATWLFLTAVLWLLAVLALATHHPGDPGFTTSGAQDRALNAVGRVGAWGSDVALFLLGYSVWWVPLIVARHWLSLLAWRLRGSPGLHADDGAAAADAFAYPALGWRVAGALMLLTASAALE